MKRRPPPRTAEVMSASAGRPAARGYRTTPLRRPGWGTRAGTRNAAAAWKWSASWPSAGVLGAPGTARSSAASNSSGSAGRRDGHRLNRGPHRAVTPVPAGRPANGGPARPGWPAQLSWSAGHARVSARRVSFPPCMMARRWARRATAVVGDQDEGETVFPPELLQQADDIVAGVLVQVAGRLVGQHHLGLLDQRPGDRHPLLLATGQLRRQVGRPVTEGHRLASAAIARCRR